MAQPAPDDRYTNVQIALSSNCRSVPKLTLGGMMELYSDIGETLTRMLPHNEQATGRISVEPLARSEGGLVLVGGPGNELGNDDDTKVQKEVRFIQGFLSKDYHECLNSVTKKFRTTPIINLDRVLTHKHSKAHGTWLKFKCYGKKHRWTVEEAEAVIACFIKAGFTYRPRVKRTINKIKSF